MMHPDERVLSKIKSSYHSMTATEQAIADYFLKAPKLSELSLQKISEALFVSKPSLSRFAKSLGFDGFRELVYQYKKDQQAQAWMNGSSPAFVSVFSDYTYIVNQIMQSIDEREINKALKIILESKVIYIYGDGLSGLAANEFMVRFKRLGFAVEVYTTDFMMHINSSTMSPSTTVIGVTLSGTTRNTVKNLYDASEYGAKTIVITSSRTLERNYHFDVVLRTFSLPQMNTGISISPQLPILLIIDLLFNAYVQLNPEKNLQTFKRTINVMKHNWLEN